MWGRLIDFATVALVFAGILLRAVLKMALVGLVIIAFLWFVAILYGPTARALGLPQRTPYDLGRSVVSMALTEIRTATTRPTPVPTARPAPTQIPFVWPSVPQERAVPVQAQAVAPPKPPTSTRVPPTATPLPGPTPTVIKGANLAGRLANDLPGSRIEMGTTVSSVLDVTAKVRDFYSVDLTAGQTLQIDGTFASPFHIQIMKPGAEPLSSRRQSGIDPYLVDLCGPMSGCRGMGDSVSRSFAAAVNGTYGVIIEVAANYAGSSGMKYTLRLSVR